MREIKELTLEHLDEYVELAYNTYPSFKDNSTEGKEKFKKVAVMKITDPNSHFIGMFEDNTLLAAMRLVNFEMNFFGKIVPASGLASVAVHLMHKKEKIAKIMVDYYETFYKERNIPIASLLPFTPEFYKKMGYGLGTKMNQYRIPAKRFPAYFGKMNLKFIKDDKGIKEIINFYSKMLQKTHGMFSKMIDEITDLYENPDNKIIASYDDNNDIDGYLIFEFINDKEDNYTINNMYIKELHYNTSKALGKILGFIKKQDDQVNLVVYNTQDEFFAQKIDNPLNDSLNYVNYGNLETNTQLIGIMYKVLDVAQAFKEYDYRNYNNVTLKVKFDITDENGNNNTIIVHFDNGKANIMEDEYITTVSLNIVDFSSLFVGSISIIGLYNLGLLSIDNLEYLKLLDLAFYCPIKPMTNTDF